MDKKKVGTLLMIVGLLCFIFALVGNILKFLPESINFVYLTGVGTVLLCSGSVLRRKNSLYK